MTKWITKRGHKFQIKNGLSKNNFKLKPNLTEMQKQSANTSITRQGRKSMPLRKIENSLGKNETIYDYGAGRGVDYLHLLATGHKATACDPNTELGKCKVHKSDVVISNYVLNTVPPGIRDKIMKDIASSTKNRAYLTVRRTGDRGTPRYDGYITSRNTFQKYFTPDELKNYTKHYFGNCKINKSVTNGDSSSVICKDPKCFKCHSSN